MIRFLRVSSEPSLICFKRDCHETCADRSSCFLEVQGTKITFYLPLILRDYLTRESCRRHGYRTSVVNISATYMVTYYGT